jgi:predicted site-specific integrase-resolvase
VRGWCASGKLKAYKLNGRDWRVRPEDLQAFLDKQAHPERKLEINPRIPALRKKLDLGAWRNHV